MFLSTSELPPWRVVVIATLGIWLLAGAAFAVNSLIEKHIDGKMARTRMRPLPRGELSPWQAIVFSGLFGGVGMWLLGSFVNPLTMWLTFATFVGYAVVYTVLLKPYTPQNIVIGGMSGAMPPVLGWAAMTNSAPAEAWLLALIIFVWTPPHFWALALYRLEDYRKAGLPMLPSHSRRGADAAAHPDVHVDIGCSHHAAVRDSNGRPAIPRCGACARRDFRRLCVETASKLQRQTGTRDVQLFDRLLGGALFAALLLDKFV